MIVDLRVIEVSLVCKDFLDHLELQESAELLEVQELPDFQDQLAQEVHLEETVRWDLKEFKEHQALEGPLEKMASLVFPELLVLLDPPDLLESHSDTIPPPFRLFLVNLTRRAQIQ